MQIPKWAINLSMRANTLTCGPKGYSLCARFYKWYLEGSVLGFWLVLWVDNLFWFDPDHCRKAYHRRAKYV